MFYEIQKILPRKRIIIWLVFICTASLIYPIYYTYNYNKDNGKKYKDVDRAYEDVWEHYKGYGIDIVSDKAYEENMNRESEFCARPISAYYYYLCKARTRKTGLQRGIYFDFNMEKHSIQGIEAQLKAIGDVNDYRYKALAREKSMMEACELEYSNTLFWERYDVLESVLTIIIFIFVLFSLSGVYTIERGSNMSIILSMMPTSDFRIITNKWLAGTLLGVCSILLVNINLAAVYILGGSASGYDKCVVNLGGEFVYTAYNITILEYMIIKVLIQTAAMIFLVVLEEYMSLISEYRYQVVLFGGILFIPQLVAYLSIGREYYKIVDILYDWSLLGGIYTNHLFYKYYAFTFGGISVDYYMVYLSLLIGLTFLTGFVTKRKYSQYISEYNRRKT